MIHFALIALLSAAWAQTPVDAPDAEVADSSTATEQEARFAFRGNERFARSDLLAVIAPLREQGLKTGFVETIRQKIESHYREQGFLAAKVTAYTFEPMGTRPRRVTYAIQEGARYELENVTFDGAQTLSQQTLLRRFDEAAAAMVQQGYYSPTLVVKAAEGLIDWMRSQGYLSAKYVGIRPDIDERKHRVRVTIYLYEGVQTLVRQYRFEGLAAFSESSVATMLALKSDAPFNPFAFTQGLEMLKQSYRNLGHLSMQIANEGTDEVVRYVNSNRWVDITLRIEEGVVYRLSEIEVQGLQKTQQEVVTRELLVQPGEVVAENLMVESEARLRRLGIFSKVTLEMADDGSDRKRARVTIEEGQPGFVAGGLGLRNDLGVRLFGEFGYTNLWGKNHSWLLRGVTNRRFQDYRFIEYQVSVSYLWPWVFLGETTFRPSLTQQKQQFIQLSTDSTILSMSLERRLVRWGNLTALLTYTLERTRQFNALDSLDNETLRIGALTPALRLDFRDNPLSPTSGLFTMLSFEFAHPLLGSQEIPYPVGYTRLQMRADYHVPISSRFNWFVSFRSGFLRNIIDPNDYGESVRGLIKVPLFKQFALGGVNSVRGYRLQEINNQDLVIRGTQSYVNYRTQLDYAISGPLRFGPFLDAANLNFDSFSLGNLKYGVGLGIHYQTPIGPVNFDWGFKLHPEPNKSTNEFYFSIGVI